MYDIAYATAALLTSPLWAYRLLRSGKWRTDWPARFGRCRLPEARRARRTILIHAVSVGEVNAIRLLVKQLEEAGEDLRLLVSATTDTGTARARQLFEPAHAVVRYPLDWTGCVGRFLDAVRPDLVALVENEVWPNFMAQCARRSIPVCVVNGRLSEHSYRRYRMIRGVARAMYGKLTAAAVQTEAYACRFEAMGTPSERIKVFDTMKWDTAQLADHVGGASTLAQAMGIDRSRPVIVAGSTGPGEERLLIDTCPDSAQLVLAPRKPERFDEVASLGSPLVRRTQHADGTVRTVDRRQRLFLLDTLGELRRAYALADVAIVGRSFLGLHGSDMIEPVALGKPTIVGRHHSNFADTVAALQAGGGIEVSEHPGEAAAALLAEPTRAACLAENGRAVIRRRQGATQRHAKLLMSVLEKAVGRSESESVISDQ